MSFEKEESSDPAETETPYHEQIDAFTIDLDNLIARYLNEFDLHMETIVGCLEMAKNSVSDPMIIDLGQEMLGDEEEE
jgi:hypothetical protein